MTRVRCFALAAVIGALSLIPGTAFAQSGPPQMLDGSPGPYFSPEGTMPMSPYRTPIPLQGTPWMGGPDDLEQMPELLGPQPLFDGAFLRTEYLHWNIRDPGNTLLGSDIYGVPNPRNDFIVYTPGTNSPLAQVRIPDLNSVSLADINGIRVTGGLNLTHGDSVEVGAFFLGRKQSGFLLHQFSVVDVNTTTFLPPVFVPTAVGTSTLVNGQLGDNILLYNKRFEAIYQSQMWGGEANYLIDADLDGLFHTRPLIGLRYLQLREKLIQIGVFSDDLLNPFLPPTFAPDVVTTIQSETINHLYGPQIGFRTELVTKYLNMGIEPKILLLGNTQFASVTTNHFRSNADPVTYTDDRVTMFTFGLDVGSYAQINITENFRVRVGYNLIYVNKVTRPEENIYYNDNGPTAPPGVVIKMTEHDFIAHGVSVGAELKY